MSYELPNNTPPVADVSAAAQQQLDWEKAASVARRRSACADGGCGSCIALELANRPSVQLSDPSQIQAV